VAAVSSPPIEARLKDLLDETRLVMLGAQLLMGIQYQVAFSPRFDRLAEIWRWLDGAALLLILTTVAMLLATPSFHQIAEEGHATGRILRRASRALSWALCPLGIAIGLDMAIGLSSSTGGPAAIAFGIAFIIGAAIAWYAAPLLMADRDRKESVMADKKQSLETRIKQALTELRVILPGAQALFGFQFTAILTDAFARLTPISQAVHLVSLGLVALAIIMLIAPAAYHRIAAGGNANSGTLRYTVRMMLPAEGLLMLGLIGDAYVTIRLITRSEILAIAIAAAAMIAFATLLYALPLIARRRHPA
jgi:hypothetical protein